MSKPIRPTQASGTAVPSYPTLRAEWERRGASRRGFLRAALAGAAGVAAAAGAGAMTGCMGAPPRPSYPQKRRLTVTIGFDRTVTFSGCGAAVERQGFIAVGVTTRNVDLVNRLRTRTSQAELRRRLTKALSPAACHHATLASFLTRVNRVLRDEVIRWYHTAAGVTLASDSLRIKLMTAVPPPPPSRRTIATD